MCMVGMLLICEEFELAATGRYHQAGASLYMPSGQAEC
jgi:hypothetical protein